MEEKPSKLSSRKFVIWIVWILILIAVIAYCIIVAIETKAIADSLVSLLEKTLSYFFGVSMMYLGVNVGQKIGLSFAENLKKETDSEK